MMMVLVIGGSMASAMSCVGSLAGWYLYDPTLNGLLSPKDDTTPYGPPAENPPAESSASTAGIPKKKKTYIFSPGCKDKASLLSASGINSTGGVGMWCKNVNNAAKWILIPTSSTAKYPTYYIKNVRYDKYLNSTSDNSLILGSAKKTWKLSWNNKTDKTYSIQEADGSLRYLSIKPEDGCKFNIATGRPWLESSNTYSHWKFKPDGSSGISTGADDKLVNCGNS